jgi:hypothetical protein
MSHRASTKAASALSALARSRSSWPPSVVSAVVSAPSAADVSGGSPDDRVRLAGRLSDAPPTGTRLPGSAPSRISWPLHRRLRIDRPLTGRMAQQFEMVLVMRLVFLAQLRFMRERMTPVLGARVTGMLVPTIAEARVVIRRGNESDSPGDPDRLDHQGAARA